MNTYKELWTFLKSPVYLEDQNTDSRYRSKTFVRLLFLALAISMVLGMLISASENLIGLDLGKHAIEKAFEDYSLWVVFALGIIVAPLMEELIFRWPLYLFKDKSYFKAVFWVFTLLFGYIHLSNYAVTTSIVVFSLILVLPQILLGSILGFIRVRFGLSWAIALHAAYNLILLGPILLMTALDIPIPTE